MDIFIAKFEHGNAILCRAEMIGETKHTYKISDTYTNIIGHTCYLPNRLSKDKYNVLFSENDALNFLMRLADNYVMACSRELERAKKQVVKIYEMIECNR